MSSALRHNAEMQFLSAIITINGTTLAAILVPRDQTYPEPGARLIDLIQRTFPTLPIILVSPRIGGFSHSFAHFDTSKIIRAINAETIDWRITVQPFTVFSLPF